MENSIKVAFASNDGKNIDAHFGGAKEFYIYEVSKETFSLSHVINIESKDTDKTVSLLKDIDIVYLLEIGPAAAAKVINSGIFPIKYKEVVSIDEELAKLKNMLLNNPPPFIKKILEKSVA